MLETAGNLIKQINLKPFPTVFFVISRGPLAPTLLFFIDKPTWICYYWFPFLVTIGFGGKQSTRCIHREKPSLHKVGIIWWLISHAKEGIEVQVKWILIFWYFSITSVKEMTFPCIKMLSVKTLFCHVGVFWGKKNLYSSAVILHIWKIANAINCKNHQSSNIGLVWKIKNVICRAL